MEKFLNEKLGIVADKTEPQDTVTVIKEINDKEEFVQEMESLNLNLVEYEMEEARCAEKQVLDNIKKEATVQKGEDLIKYREGIENFFIRLTDDFNEEVTRIITRNEIERRRVSERIGEAAIRKGKIKTKRKGNRKEKHKW